ncbi:MAG: hypothetical protein ACKVW3_08040 [Phycisphaerales bacterium]
MATATPTRRVNREDVVRLGQSGRPWDFLPVLTQVLRVAPGDAGLRVLGAANLARLGLNSVAIEMLEPVPSEAGEAVVSLRALLSREKAEGGMKSDRVEVEELVTVARMNLAVAGAKLDLGGAMERWIEAAREWEWFRAADGNVIRRRGDEWRGLADHVGAAARFVKEHLETAGDLAVLTLEGIDPPWLLKGLAGALARRKDGFEPRLVAVQADEMEFLDGMAQTDLREVMGREGLELFVGADATERLGKWLAVRQDRKIAGPLVPLMSLRKRTTPATEVVLRTAEREQLAEHERLVERVSAAYAGRDRAWWRERLKAERLRVLVPTCRFSTFIKHSSEDLAAALRRAGHEALVLMEADSSSRMSSLAYLRALDEYRPDAVVLINYMRWHLGPWFPREVPFVTWIQDAMPQQFEAAAGGVGEQDFVIGHVHPELISQVGYAESRTMPMPVVASEGKFHAGPVEAGLKKRLACEVAFVSHHSETPEAMHARLCDEAERSGSGVVVRRILERARAGVAAAAMDVMDPRLLKRLEDVVRAAALEELGGATRTGSDRDEQAAVVATIVRQYAIPLAERIARHEVLGWAARLCARRGWRCRVFGRGWEQHPAFAALAGGELEHGEALRSAYQSATVQLHVSLSAMVHQRVMECAMSGGLPLCLLTGPSLAMVESALRREAWSAEGMAACEVKTRRLGARVADSAALMRLVAQRQRLGLESCGTAGTEEFAWFATGRSDRERPKQMPGEQRADLLLGDLAETTFRNEAGLERLAERAIERPRWREAVSGMIAGRSRDRLTHGALVPRLLELVRRGQEDRG